MTGLNLTTIIIILNVNIPIKRQQRSDWIKIGDIGTKVHVI